MKKFYAIITVLVVLLGQHIIFAQEEDVPYLSDDDMASIEVVLPDDIPEVIKLSGEIGTEAGKETPIINEISRLNVHQPLYHLLILDRSYCVLNSDIGGINNSALLYKLKHGRNGYLIVIYKVPNSGPVFPILPNNSRIILDLMTNRPSTIREYVNSSAFKKFVTSRTILAQIENVFKTKF